MTKKLPVGIDGFEKIRRNDFYYVDKSMFIADLLRSWGEVNLFTRPRRFGKSLNMSMLKAFFEIGSDKGLFDGLRISREKELCAQYMGQYPVVSISLKGVDGLSYSEAVSALRRTIGREALRFSFLADSPRLLPGEKEMYQALTAVEDGTFSMSKEVMIDSLRTLSQLLSQHYNRGVIMLIDEYDVPLDKAFQSGYYDEMISLIRNLFSNALKGNDSLQFAVLTGCLRISRESIFTGLNNIKIHSITDTRFDEYFGFTDDDVRELLSYYNLTDHEKKIRQWYDGYQFGREAVYCPWDVINYCDALLTDPDAQPENYWANTSGNSLVLRFIKRAGRETRDEIEGLLSGDSITKNIKDELTYPELDQSVDHLWSVLFSTGYLTQRGRSDGKCCHLVIPNLEIRELFREQIQSWFQEMTRTDSSKLEQFCLAFQTGETEQIETMLREYLWNSISVRDTAVRINQKENFYHGMLLGLLQYESKWSIRSNAESGAGYSDIMIKTPDRVGIVIELKYAQNGNLEHSCEQALDQIADRRYDAALLREGMKQIIKYGIAFYGKDCMVIKG